MPIIGGAKPKPIVVVEPHPDDAFLSVGHHLEKLWANASRLIVTVYSDSRRAEEGEAYAKAIGASYACLGLPESDMRSEGPIEAPKALASFLERLEWSHILFPLGLQHPDHKRVREASKNLENVLYYLDTPYLSKLMLAEELLRKVEGRIIESLCFPPATKWRHTALFKTQAKFFHFNPLKEWKLPEIILCR